jgi:hypothetical protein
VSQRSPWLQPGNDLDARRPWLASPNTGPAGNAMREREPGCASCRDAATMRTELARLRSEAVEAGRAEGRAEIAVQRAVLSAAATAVNRARVTREQALTELVVDVALGLCVELAPAATGVDRRALAQLVHRAIAEAGGDKAGPSHPVTLRMCAEDAAMVGGLLPSGVVCEIGADLVAGEVWVEAPRLVVDGRWAPRFAALREPLLALVRAAEPSLELASDEPSDGEAEDDDHGP